MTLINLSEKTQRDEIDLVALRALDLQLEPVRGNRRCDLEAQGLKLRPLETGRDRVALPLAVGPEPEPPNALGIGRLPHRQLNRASAGPLPGPKTNPVGEGLPAAVIAPANQNLLRPCAESERPIRAGGQLLHVGAEHREVAPVRPAEIPRAPQDVAPQFLFVLVCPKRLAPEQLLDRRITCPEQAGAAQCPEHDRRQPKRAHRPPTSSCHVKTPAGGLSAQRPGRNTPCN